MSKRPKLVSDAAGALSAVVAPSQQSEIENDEKLQRGRQQQQMIRRMRAAVRDSNVSGVTGLMYVPEVVSPDEAKDLLGHIDAQPWSHELRRRVQHYGWRYNYKQRAIKADDNLGPLPSWIQSVCRRLKTLHVVPEDWEFDQAIVNEYVPGQGIAAHVDQPDMFGTPIVILSLNSAITMEFTHCTLPKHKQLRLQPNSLVYMTGEARYKWKHAIRPQMFDVMADGSRVPRGRRVSLTLRRVKRSAVSGTAGEAHKPQ